MLLIKSASPEAFQEWQACLSDLAPDLQVRDWQDRTVDPASVRYVLVWQPEPGRIAGYPECRLILSGGAGVDHILSDPELPAHLPIVRMVTPETAEKMADYVTMATYALIRDFPQCAAAQREKRWDRTLTGRVASETTVGIMGLGQLGSAAAARLAGNGFRVLGWSRTPKKIAGVQSFAGASDFGAFIAQSTILVNLLPETADTRGFINADLLRRLPRGASVINVGRGSQLDNKALIEALGDGQVRNAMLDVFSIEPLPVTDPLWTHPAVSITPHVASEVSCRSKARHVADSIAADVCGQSIAHLYDPKKGY